MNNMFGMIGVIFLVCGLYCFWAFFKMKKTGEPSDVILLSKTDVARPCRDKAAFMAKSMPLVLMLSITTTLYGIIDVINYYVYSLHVVDMIAGFAFFVVIVIYLVQTQKLKRTYYL